MPMDLALFGHELRDYRSEIGFSRTEFAKLIGVSDYTLRSWENGQQTPQSSTLWQVLNRLSSPAAQKSVRHGNLDRVRDIFERYARNADLSPVDSFQTRLLQIEKTLSGSVLKASQTDFEFDEQKRSLIAIPFDSDLALFEAADRLAVNDLLEDAKESALGISERLPGTNISQRYLISAFGDYGEQADRDRPNPRILYRKGDLIRYVFDREDITSAVDELLLREIEQFLNIHNELMRRLFGKSLNATRAISADKVSDDVAKFAAEAMQNVVNVLDSTPHQEGLEEGAIDEEIVAVSEDIAKEISDLTDAFEQTNDPSLRALRLSRIKIASFHGALMVGRLLLRSAGVAIRFSGRVTSAGLQAGANLTAITAFVEVQAPGTIRAAYELLRGVIPDLPALPII